MRPSTVIAGASFAWIATLCAPIALAGAITVSPTRIELSARHPLATLEVRNEGNDSVTMQLDRMAWTQPDGQDVYLPSSAFVATPTVFELGPHSTQVLRISLRDKAPGEVERAYRLYTSEVPDSQQMSGSGIQMSLRIGVPIFAEIMAAKPRFEVNILAPPNREGAVSIRNAGGHFTRALSLEVRNSAGKVLWQSQNPAYLLANGEHRWPLEAGAAGLLADDGLRMSIRTETGIETVDVQRQP